MYKIKTTHDFDKDFKKLDSDIASRVLKKLEWLSEHPEVLRFPLKNLPENIKGLQKYRIGDYRILLWVDNNKHEIILYGIEHRRSVYDDI